MGDKNQSQEEAFRDGLRDMAAALGKLAPAFPSTKDLAEAATLAADGNDSLLRLLMKLATEQKR